MKLGSGTMSTRCWRIQLNWRGPLLMALLMGSLVLARYLRAQLSNADVKEKSEKIQALLQAEKFNEAEPLVRESIRQLPNEIYFLAQLEVVLNGQGKFRDADELRNRIRALWERNYRSEWIAKGSPVGESSWLRVVSSSKDYHVFGVEYFVPRLIEGAGPKDPLALFAYYKVIAVPKTGNGPSRVFQLNKSKSEKAYFLEEFSDNTITLDSTYGTEIPDIRTVVGDAARYLDGNQR